MSFHLRDEEVNVSADVGMSNIMAHSAEVDALRTRLGIPDNFITSLGRFVTRATLAGEIPIMFRMHRENLVAGVVLLRFRRKYGVPIGVVSAGDGTGEGSVIAATRDRIPMLESASRILVKIPLIHTVVLTALWPEPACPSGDWRVRGTEGHWHFREVGFRLDLSDGAAGTMDRLGYKMRRNLGSSRRRAETRFGCSFIPELCPEQRLQAVEALCGEGTYRMGARKARELEAMLLAVPGSFAMGLQGSKGEWLSYIAGWRTRDGTYIDWQLNREYPVNASMSMVIRSYLLEQELARQSPAIIFVGGTTPHWSRACVPMVCGDLLIIKKDFLGSASGYLARRFSPSGQLAKLQGRPSP